MKSFKEIREMTQRFVFDNPRSFKNAERLAKRFKLETDSEKQMGNYFLAVTGKVAAVSKWLKALEKGEVSEETVDEANLKQLKRKHKRHIDAAKKGKDLPKKVEYELLSWAMDNGEIKTDDADESDEWLMNNVLEGVYTKNDGGAFDGLRIAKYLSDKDGNPRWSRVPYGTSDSYLRTAMDMLKKDPKKARAILSKPTPRSGSL